jgi:hypothetical protein
MWKPWVSQASAEDTLLMSIFPDVYSFLPYVTSIWKSDQIQGSLNFCNRLIFYGERLLDPRQTSKLEAHSLLAVCGCLFNLLALPFIAGGHILHLQTEDVPCRCDKGPT